MDHKGLDVSKLLILADLCVLESERIQQERVHLEMIFQSFPKKQRTKTIHINCLNAPATLQSQPETSKNKERMRANHDVGDNEWQPRPRPLPRQTLSNKKSKKKQKEKNVKVRRVKMEEEAIPIPVPAWVEELVRTRLHNALPVVHVFDKPLQKSDTDKGLRRIFIPSEDSERVLLPALTQQEKGRLGDGITVMGLDQNGNSWNLQLKYWPSVGVHVFQKDWIDLVTKNHLTAVQDTVQVWLSRYSIQDRSPQEENSLCFFIGWKHKKM
ncbi:hypothetical protein MRB53_014562 [Persea americana]|uniref:Uncharacterized protein n=1 Tax=Persea americana TaxID=3435 RepID=A0ACC2KBC6_PERAE|nr:hypothetical protein MRB53_014562 [Persea americana]